VTTDARPAAQVPVTNDSLMDGDLEYDEINCRHVFSEKETVSRDTNDVDGHLCVINQSSGSLTIQLCW